MVTKESKELILKRQLEIIENTLYECEIQCRVATKINDTATKKRASEQMLKFEKMKDEYKCILKELTDGKD